MRLLIFGHTGKLGRALQRAFEGDCEALGQSGATGFDASDLDAATRILEAFRPDVVANAIAFTGVEPCEREPERAFRINTLFPGHLAALSEPMGFRLLHFSTDAVFDGRKASGPYMEADGPAPLNVYGLTKFGGDALVASRAERQYTFRLSLLFGEATGRRQFVERLVAQLREGPVRVAGDVVCSPSFADDVAGRVREVVQGELPFGLYHTASAGQASLYDLVSAIAARLGLAERVACASHRDFGASIPRALRTPLASSRQPALRPWQEAVEACFPLESQRLS